MTAIDTLKSAALAAIDARRQWLIDVAQTVLRNPEPGFREFDTARLVSQRMSELGVEHDTGIAVTGIKGRLPGGHPSPSVAIIGEMDCLRVPGHPYADPKTAAAHACGHHCQPASMLGAAVGLMASEVAAALDGGVVLMALPAEEFIDVEQRLALRREGRIDMLSGKQEFIRLGAFDDVDVAMMVHTSASSADGSFSVGGTSNGHLVKHVEFIGRAAHAGSLPHRGINALQAALVALNALNAQRETLKNEDVVRLHGIVTAGGDAANSVPSTVRYEGRVRARSAEALQDASDKMDRCLRAGALALGAKVRIVTVPGYLPIRHDRTMTALFQANAERLVGTGSVIRHPWDRVRGGSTDMGDLSQIMPVIHPYSGGARGMGHAADYVVDDYDRAVIQPAKVMAMTAIDLLANGATGASDVLSNSKPPMTKAQYLRHQSARFDDELYQPV